MKKKGLDVSLFYSFGQIQNPNIKYLSGYDDNCILCISDDSFIIASDRDYEKASKMSNIKVYKKGKHTFSEALFEKLKSNMPKRIGIDKEHWNLKVYENIKKKIKGRYIDITDTCRQIRSIKTSSEIKKIKKACKVTDNIFKNIISDFHFKTEKDLSVFIEDEIRKAGCSLAFDPIVASGKGSSEPHYSGSKKIKKGFLLLDYGARYDGYCSDMSRTIYIGKPSQKEIEDYKNVLNVQKECIRSTKNNISCNFLYQRSIKLFGKKSRFFIHSLGHGLGLDIHEHPNISPLSKDKLKLGMTFTIEPGLYYENRYGIRIEDTLLLTDKGPKRLTLSDKKLIAIQRYTR